MSYKVKFVRQVSNESIDGMTIGNVYEVYLDMLDDKDYPTLTVIDDTNGLNTLYPGEFEVVDDES